MKMSSKYSQFEKYMQTVLRRDKNQNAHLDDNDNVEKSRSTVAKLPQDRIITTEDVSQYYFPLFYAGEKGPLGIWEKKEGLGHIKRRVEVDGPERYHVLELLNARNNLGTYIAVPKKEWMSLHISLPHLVIVVRNLRRSFSFGVQVLDTRGFLRRFDISTGHNPAHLRKWPNLCQLPLALEIGWNEIHLDLNDLLWRTYKSSCFETARLVINANCRVRQVFFCADNVISGEQPIPAMQRFENMKIVKITFGPMNHPNYTEPGPNFSRDVVIPDPAENPAPTRIETDLRRLHITRFNQIIKWQLKEPYRSYYKTLLEKSSEISPPEQHQKQDENVKKKKENVHVDKAAPASADDEMPSDAVPIPIGLTGPIGLNQLMNGSVELRQSPRSHVFYQYNKAMVLLKDNKVKIPTLQH